VSFTDEDLKRLKELPDNVVITFKEGPSVKLKTLLARLEAAEKLVLRGLPISALTCKCELCSGWRKEAGK
jgi:hypothetical protein